MGHTQNPMMLLLLLRYFLSHEYPKDFFTIYHRYWNIDLLELVSWCLLDQKSAFRFSERNILLSKGLASSTQLLKTNLLTTAAAAATATGLRIGLRSGLRIRISCTFGLGLGLRIGSWCCRVFLAQRNCRILSRFEFRTILEAKSHKFVDLKSCAAPDEHTFFCTTKAAYN